MLREERKRGRKQVERRNFSRIWISCTSPTIAPEAGVPPLIHQSLFSPSWLHSLANKKRERSLLLTLLLARSANKSSLLFRLLTWCLTVFLPFLFLSHNRNYVMRSKDEEDWNDTPAEHDALSTSAHLLAHAPDHTSLEGEICFFYPLPHAYLFTLPRDSCPMHFISPLVNAGPCFSPHSNCCPFRPAVAKMRKKEPFTKKKGENCMLFGK